MTIIRGNKYGIMVYLSPETYEMIATTKNKNLSNSAYCATLIDEAVSTKM